MPDDELVEVYRARGLPEAHALRLLLEQDGITVRVDNELLQGAVGELPMGWATAPRIVVRQSDETRARAIVDGFLQRRGGHDSAALNCLACGTKMGEHDTCPACGWTYSDAESSVEDGASADEQPDDAEPDSPPPVPADPALSWEVAAVLAIGVFPSLATAIADAFEPYPPTPFLADALTYTASSVCAAFAVLFIIHRSGVSWAAFGITRPRVTDVLIGLCMMLASIALYNALQKVMRPTSHAAYFTDPQTWWEHLLMVLMYLVGGFKEELVCRAYLITRLERLRQSPAQAVVISALLFASYHVYQGWPGFVDTFAMGVLYGCVFLLVRRLWPLALGHALFNIYLTT